MVIEITDSSKAKNILLKEINDHEAELQRLREASREKTAEKTQQIFNLGMLILQLRNPQIGDNQIDQIFIEDDNQGQQIRANMSTITGALQIVYDLDPVTPVDQVPETTREIINRHTADW